MCTKIICLYKLEKNIFLLETFYSRLLQLLFLLWDFSSMFFFKFLGFNSRMLPNVLGFYYTFK